MLDDLYENNGYEVQKRKAEDRSAWRESIRVAAVQQTTEDQHCFMSCSNYH